MKQAKICSTNESASKIEVIFSFQIDTHSPSDIQRAERNVVIGTNVVLQRRSGFIILMFVTTCILFQGGWVKWKASPPTPVSIGLISVEHSVSHCPKGRPRWE